MKRSTSSLFREFDQRTRVVNNKPAKILHNLQRYAQPSCGGQLQSSLRSPQSLISHYKNPPELASRFSTPACTRRRLIATAPSSASEFHRAYPPINRFFLSPRSGRALAILTPSLIRESAFWARFLGSFYLPLNA